MTLFKEPTPAFSGTLTFEAPIWRHPELKLLPDWRNHQLLEEWTYEWVHSGNRHALRLPKGFVTDLASTPRLIWWLINPTDLKHASLPHDLIYRRAGWIGEFYAINGELSDARWTQRQADRLMARIMRDASIPVWRRRMAYRGLRLAGWVTWRQHERRMALERGEG